MVSNGVWKVSVTSEWLMSRIKRLIVSMGCKVGCVTLYRNVSHPVSQIMKRSAGKVSQARQAHRPYQTGLLARGACNAGWW